MCIDKNTFKQIFIDHWNEFISVYPIFDSPTYSEPIQKMLDCGDPEKMGYVSYICTNCGERRRIAFTCKSCFCLSCSKVYTDKWADFIGRRLLPGITYRHIVLTVPDFLHTWLYRDSSLFTPFIHAGNAFVKDVFNTYTGLVLDIGTIIVLQTAGRSGEFNPHLHILVPAGGITPDGKWKPISYIPYTLFHKKWQYHLLSMLREHVSVPAVEIDIDRAWRSYPKGFVAYFEKGKVPPGGKGLAKYLAKYVVSPPISLKRIEHYDGKTVRYWYRDHKTGKILYETLPVLRFIGRMAQHILPKGFQRIRYFGLHSNPRYQRMRNYISEIITADTPSDPRGYRVLPRTPFTQLFFKNFGSNPLICSCGNLMELELIYHPRYGIIRDYWDTLCYEQPRAEQQAPRMATENATGDALARPKRMVQLSLPFL